MNGQASIEGYLSSRNLFRPRLRRIETPVETPAIGAALEARAPEELSEEKFIRFAEENPARLVELLRSNAITRPALLTFAAEAAGRIANSALVVTTLLPLLGHAEPVVREALEPSPGVKAAIEDALAVLD